MVNGSDSVSRSYMGKIMLGIRNRVKYFFKLFLVFKFFDEILQKCTECCKNLSQKIDFFNKI